jgi:hypothetical protein
MRKHFLLGIASLTLAFSNLSLVGCAGQAVDPGPTTSSQSAEPLTITEQDDYHVAGTFTHGSSLVTFVSRMSTDGVSTVQLNVNGATLSVTVDLFEHAAKEDGGGSTLLVEDLRTLHAFEKHLDAHGQNARTWERLFKAVAMYAAAPAGYTVLARPIGVRPDLRDGSGRENGTVSDESVIYMCVGYGNHPLYTGDDWVWAEHDSRPDEGATNAYSGNANHYRLQGFYGAGCRLDGTPGAAVPGSYDQGSNPQWLGYDSNTGYWSDGASYNDTSAPNAQGGTANTQGSWNGGGACEGRCGAGCPRTYNFYFTKDCMDHDICLDYHRAASSTSSSGDCGYEFQDAQSDFLTGTSLGYTSDCGNVPSDCPEANGYDGVDDSAPSGL